MEAEMASTEALIMADRYEEAASAAYDLFELSLEAGLQVGNLPHFEHHPAQLRWAYMFAFCVDMRSWA